LGIGLAPPERTSAAHVTRDFICAPAGLKDGISGDFDAMLKTAGIETDAFAIRLLILGHLDELKRTHDDPGSRSRPGFVGSSSASPIVIISKNLAGHRCRR